MNAKKLVRIGDLSLALAMAAAVVGALSIMSMDSMAFAKNGSDDGASSSDDNGGDRGGRGSDDRGSDDRGGDRGGRSSDDSYDDNSSDDHGWRHGGHGADDGIVTGGGTVAGPDLAAVVSDFTGRGFRVLEIKREHGAVVEVEVIDPRGVHLEMYYDAATKTVLSQHLED